MKRLITIVLLLYPVMLIAQEFKFHVQGVVQDTSHAKFAYLSTLSHRVDLTSQKIFLVTPVVDGKFEFKGTADLEGKDYQTACVFVDDRSNISKEELASKYKLLVWVAGREENIKVIALEDLSLAIQGRDEMKDAKVVKNGVLTSQLDEWDIAYRAKKAGIIRFIKKYPDSPISFEQVESLSRYATFSDGDKLVAQYGRVKEMYPLLSERLKNSKRGKALGKKLKITPGKK